MRREPFGGGWFKVDPAWAHSITNLQTLSRVQDCRLTAVGFMKPHGKLKRLALCIISGVTVIGALIYAMAGHLHRSPVSTAFLGYENADGFCEAVVSLRNNSNSRIRCQGLMSCSRRDTDQQLEIGRYVNIELASKEQRFLTVIVPHGPGPARVTCGLTLAARHGGLVRAIGALLAKAGVYVYHASPAQTVVPGATRTQSAYASATLSNLKVETGTRKSNASLSDWLLIQNYTNQWNTP